MTADQNAIAINAAGIADAFRVLQVCDEDGANRLGDLSQIHEGWIGVIGAIADAALVMETYRVGRGPTASWGGELPYLYDAWDSIAKRLWDGLGSSTVEELALEGIFDACSVEEE